ncbi:hypothetical protein LXL04_002568 [Taraxacum kok-saghyz]
MTSYTISDYASLQYSNHPHQSFHAPIPFLLKSRISSQVYQVSHVACQICPQLSGKVKDHHSSSDHSNHSLRDSHLSLMPYPLSSYRTLKMKL